MGQRSVILSSYFTAKINFINIKDPVILLSARSLTDADPP